MKSFKFGFSGNNLPIIAHEFGNSGPHILILGGVHGDEVEGVNAALGLIDEYISQTPSLFKVTVVPKFNIDGVLAKQRKNSRGVDLNRNLPTKDWTANVAEEKYFPGTEANSESENQALVTWLQNNNVNFILSLHSWKPLLNTNGDCSPIADVISDQTGYIIKDSIGYPTPGCLGTFTGLEQGIPTLTYEIERGLEPQKVLTTHVPAITKAIVKWSKNH